MMRIFPEITCVAMLLLTGRAAGAPAAAREKPVFDPVVFFTGRAHSTGVMKYVTGSSVKVETSTVGRFHAGLLDLEQDLQFSDGKRQHRSWRIGRLDAHHFEATANDMVGSARGEAHGNTFRWNFLLALSSGNPLTNVRLSQTMILQPDGRTVANETTITKLGLVVARVSERFVRLTDQRGAGTRR
ncbi:MAG: DUF3833 family protein [Verrucomicrobiota bacterium]